MTDANDSINVTRFRDGEENGIGLTKLEYFAAIDNTPLPEIFAHAKLKEFNERTQQTRNTAGSAFELMNSSEKAETRMAWKVLCAKTLIAELNKEQ